MLVDLLVGDEVIHISYGEFELWVREGRIPEGLPIRYPPLTGAAFVPAAELDLYRRLRDDVAARVMRRFSLGRFAPVSAAVSVACVAIFAAMVASLVRDGMPWREALLSAPVDALVEWGAKEPGRVLELGEWWRLTTAVLLHAGLLHLLPNVAYIAYVGWNVENVYGSAGTAVIFAASAAAASGLSLLGTAVPSVGASGVTFGLFSAAVVFGWRYGFLLPGAARRKFGWAFLPFLAFFLFLGLRSSVVDNWSHVGGCVGGGLAALLLLPALVEADGERVVRMRRRAAAAAVLAAIPLALAMPPGGALAGLLPELRETYEDPRAGWSFAVPSYWKVTTDRFGADTFASPTRREAVAHQVVPAPTSGGPPSPREDLLAHLGGDPHVRVRPESARTSPRVLAGREWSRIRVTVETGEGPWEVERYVLDEGGLRVALTFEHPLEDADRYAALRERILASVRLEGGEGRE
ncbi:rhomboid family intramembrane serine protease [Myxococcota bacterium]|nr:rhomboid family intramembrane serine protease [Myxococcota bacterium]